MIPSVWIIGYLGRLAGAVRIIVSAVSSSGHSGVVKRATCNGIVNYEIIFILKTT